ncbi:histidine phosphatase family protein [uncultured Shewanella sp.]|uniref:histidine phosphatase family protein n=1 Tax=uncultured Shewanella sp. TaxID=173975 RepID=UPI00260B53ED|nr:alpha-ribazole phosphatase family protein [uncultured Shewanella sp.]
MKTDLYLLRHGECQGGHILRGRVDVPLSSNGFVQMQRAIEKLPQDPDVIVSSPLRRCIEFAHQLHVQKGIELRVYDGLKEMDFGDWDGRTFDELYATFEPALSRYWRDPWNETPPNGEPMLMFEHRVDNAWQQLLECFKGRRVLVVAHGGVIRHIMSRVLGVKRCAGIYSQLALGYGATVNVEVHVKNDGEDEHNVHQVEHRQFYSRLHWPN